MTRLLDVLGDYLDWRGFGYLRLDGGTNAAERGDLVSEFNAPGVWVMWSASSTHQVGTAGSAAGQVGGALLYEMVSHLAGVGAGGAIGCTRWSGWRVWWMHGYRGAAAQWCRRTRILLQG
jgi:hypothetical protein